MKVAELLFLSYDVSSFSVRYRGYYISYEISLRQQAGPSSAVGRALDMYVRGPVWPHTFVSPSADSRGAVVSYWQKYVHEVLVNCLGGLNLPKKSVVRLTDRLDMTLDVYHGRKTTTQPSATFINLK